MKKATNTLAQLAVKITSFPTNSNWVEGTCSGYTFQAKLYDVPSEYGINGGRVSKLEVRDQRNNVVINYDRGWDVVVTKATADICTVIMAMLENSPKRFAN